MVFPEFSSLSKATLVACGIVAASFSLNSTASEASDAVDNKSQLSVILDRAKVVRIAKPADTIIIGNPSVVDVTIQDARTVVLTGRNYGTTNIIVLDSDGDPIVDETIVVKGDDTNLVRVYRQAAKQTLTCSPVCENSLSVGDDDKAFSTTNSQISARNGLAESNAKN